MPAFYRMPVLMATSCRLALVVLTVAAWRPVVGAQTPADLEFFEQRIRPALAEHCHKCHGAEKPKAHLRLDSRANALKGGDSGRAVVPGAPAQSLMLKAIGYGDPELRMPPRGKLPDAVIADFTKWIQLGAPWPDDAGNQKLPVAKEFDLKARSRHWSLRPLQLPTTPRVKNAAWVQTPIDAFILARLEEKGLTPAPPADPRTLLRRMYFDVIGLPPTVHEMEEFVQAWDGSNAKRQALIAQVADRLLSSPRYGERWARHWLDLVRYAETQGHEFDFEIADAWKYRDYVIRALNDDVPYDQFVREHIAGDLLGNPRRHPQTRTNESILGAGFWWLGEAKHSPVDSRADQADRIDNQIDVFGKAFLGLTIACARCHDHKFDAISTKDYYALAGYLQSSRQDRAFIDSAAERRAKLAPLVKVRTAIGNLLPPQKFIRPRLGPSAGEALASFAKGTWGDWTVTGEAFGTGPSGPGAALIRPEQDHGAITALPPGLAHSALLSTKLHGALRSPTFVLRHGKIHYRLAGKQARVNVVVNGLQLIREPIYGSLTFAVDNEAMHWRTQDVSMWLGQRAYIEVLDDGPGYAVLEQVILSDDDRPPDAAGAGGRMAPAPAALVPLLEEFRKYEAALDAPRRALATADGNGVNEHVFIRGNPKKLGAVVPRRFLEVFGGVTPPPGNGSGRLELAEHMLDPGKTPILPRVLVNRVWKHHFGEGIVRSPDDFGVLGQAPTHPELLDYLALEFVRNGWSLKKLHKLMVLSATYQQASSPKASNASLGGRPSRRANPDTVDPDNKLLQRMPVRRLEAEAIRDAMLAVSGRLDPTPFGPSVPVHLTPFMVGRGRPGVGGPLDGHGRRSIYIAVRRNFLTPMFVAFDYPTPFSTIGRRSVSNVPAQALTMLNNPLVLQQAELWARRVLKEAGMTAAERVRRMFETGLGRPPTASELADALAFFDEQTRIHGRADDVRSWTEFAHVLFNVKEFIFVN
ncbi:MAG: PSD1 and planctomycete cytochrome C domain-containing protein [Gemmataceae bacterium]|nr:PSD1 and planctomycete cytochrome C domain-containing protein [Gemmataceae bacterium]